MEIGEKGRYTISLAREEAEDYPFVILASDAGRKGTFYDLMALKLGLSDDDMMDCREICISRELQDSWYGYVGTVAGAGEALTMRLAMAGPKVSPILHGLQVSWTDGFVVRKQG